MFFRATPALLVLLVLAVGPARATPGDLDGTFGVSGKVTTAIGQHSGAGAIAFQPDGKIVAAGWSGSNGDVPEYFALARYTGNGSLDQSFGTGGTATTAFGSQLAEAVDLALQPDGKLVTAGYTSTGGDFSFVLVRYTSVGSPDTTFGDNGVVTTDFGSIAELAGAVVVQPDGKIVAAGQRGDGYQNDFALARYNPDGSLDPSFDGDGKVTTSIGVGSGVAALVRQPDGKLVAAGGSSGNGSEQLFALARYNPDGSLDESFGAAGIVTTAFGSMSAHLLGLVLQPDGKLVAGGWRSDGTHSDITLARYERNGALDSTFGDGGRVTAAFGSLSTAAFSVAMQSDGRIVTGGTFLPSDGNSHFFLARYNADGSIDPRFGVGGKVITALGSFDYAQDVAVQLDGKIVAAGTAGRDAVQGGGFALARYAAAETPCVVPRVTRTRLATARRAILGSHCSVGRITRAFSASIGKGRVVSQRPAPGTRRPERSAVRLVVSKGARKRR